MRIYIAGPYSADTEEQRLGNVRAAIVAGLELLKVGHAPFIPHMTHWFDLETNHAVKYEQYLWWDSEFLKVCDAMLFLGLSLGSNLEREQARRNDMPIYYSLSAVPPAEAIAPMTAAQEAHLAGLGRKLRQRLDRKYRAGQKEHGGDLFSKTGLLEESLDEIVDLLVYITTEKDQRGRE